MLDPIHLRQLLQDMLESGRTPEEVCADSPELIHEVSAQWQRLRNVEDQVEALFPVSEMRRPSAHTRWDDAHAGLPPIPGYDMESLIGHGGMGVVYKARHRILNRPVAIKMMLAGLYAGAGERERFMREAQAMASLRHPNIVQVHDVGDFEGLPFITMELVEGVNLAGELAGMPQPVRQAAKLVATLADAVQAAHDSGIIHRDLKPANILLAGQQRPKITDFGLARRIEAAPALTFSGARMGTPSYMAPEQVIGKTGSVGPAVDIYALGAILYETLTGRPPFRGETVAETERQVISQEPVSPARLNARVPRDLETICLKCLQKHPHRRYVRASALAEDLERFLRHEPILARPVGIWERVAKWVWRRPALATGLVSGLLLCTILLSAGLWMMSERAATLQAVEQDLVEALSSQRVSAWSKANDALQRAKIRLGSAGAAGLRRRLDQAARDQELVALLDAIRFKRAGRVNGTVGYGERDYEQTFREAGLCRVDERPDVVAARISASNVRQALVAALDDWALCESRGPDVSRVRWLLDLARRTDPDPTGWRDRFRDPAVRADRSSLIRLAEEANVDQTPVNLLMTLGELLQKQGGPAVPFLKKVQKKHPTDFWANHQLGFALNASEPMDAIRFYQTALALRPETPGLLNNLAGALARSGQADEAVYYFRQAVRLDPGKAMYRASLGLSLNLIGRAGEAVAQFQQGLALQPEPETIYRIQRGLRDALMRQGQINEWCVAWRKLTEAYPADHWVCNGYAEFCLYLRKEHEYRLARRALLAHSATIADPNIAERTGRACLLLTPSEDELIVATALIDLALAKDASKPFGHRANFLFAKGLAEYRRGQIDRAIAIMEGPARPVLGPAPRLVMAMCRQRLGQKDQARAILAAAVASHDWTAARVTGADDWIYHVLRREAEAMISPDKENDASMPER